MGKSSDRNQQVWVYATSWVTLGKPFNRSEAWFLLFSRGVSARGIVRVSENAGIKSDEK